MQRPTHPTPIQLTDQLKHHTLHNLIHTPLHSTPTLRNITIIAQKSHQILYQSNLYYNELRVVGGELDVVGVFLVFEVVLWGDYYFEFIVEVYLEWG